MLITNVLRLTCLPRGSFRMLRDHLRSPVSPRRDAVPDGVVRKSEGIDTRDHLRYGTLVSSRHTAQDHPMGAGARPQRRAGPAGGFLHRHRHACGRDHRYHRAALAGRGYVPGTAGPSRRPAGGLANGSAKSPWISAAASRRTPTGMPTARCARSCGGWCNAHATRRRRPGTGPGLGFPTGGRRRRAGAWRRTIRGPGGCRAVSGRIGRADTVTDTESETSPESGRLRWPVGTIPAWAGLLGEAGARLEGIRLLNGRFVLKAELGDAALQILVPSGRAFGPGDGIVAKLGLSLPLEAPVGRMFDLWRVAGRPPPPRTRPFRDGRIARWCRCWTGSGRRSRIAGWPSASGARQWSPRSGVPKAGCARRSGAGSRRPGCLQKAAGATSCPAMYRNRGEPRRH